MTSLIQLLLKGIIEKGDEAIIAICNTRVPSQIFINRYKNGPPVEQSEYFEFLFNITKELFPHADDDKFYHALRVIYSINQALEDEKLNNIPQVL